LPFKKIISGSEILHPQQPPNWGGIFEQQSEAGRQIHQPIRPNDWHVNTTCAPCLFISLSRPSINNRKCHIFREPKPPYFTSRMLLKMHLGAISCMTDTFSCFYADGWYKGQLSLSAQECGISFFTKCMELEKSEAGFHIMRKLSDVKTWIFYVLHIMHQVIINNSISSINNSILTSILTTHEKKNIFRILTNFSKSGFPITLTLQCNFTNQLPIYQRCTTQETTISTRWPFYCLFIT